MLQRIGFFLLYTFDAQVIGYLYTQTFTISYGLPDEVVHHEKVVAQMRKNPYWLKEDNP